MIWIIGIFALLILFEIIQEMVKKTKEKIKNTKINKEYQNRLIRIAPQLNLIDTEDLRSKFSLREQVYNNLKDSFKSKHHTEIEILNLNLICSKEIEEIKYLGKIENIKKIINKAIKL